MSEISFKDLAKLIHPDTNPDIENPSEKMTLALRNRGDKKALWNLAVQWGVVEGEMNADATAVTGDVHIRVETGGRYGGFDPQGNPFTGRGWSTGSPSQGADAGLTQIRVNDVVQFYAQRASHHAVVVDIIVNEFAVVSVSIAGVQSSISTGGMHTLGNHLGVCMPLTATWSMKLSWLIWNYYGHNMHRHNLTPILGRCRRSLNPNLNPNLSLFSLREALQLFLKDLFGLN